MSVVCEWPHTMREEPRLKEWNVETCTVVRDDIVVAFERITDGLHQLFIGSRLPWFANLKSGDGIADDVASPTNRFHTGRQHRPDAGLEVARLDVEADPFLVLPEVVVLLGGVDCLGILAGL